MTNRFALTLALSVALGLGSPTSAQNPAQKSTKPPPERAQLPAADDAAREGDAEVEAASAQVAKLFNAGQATQLAELFLSQGELIDDGGNTYRGSDEIESLLKKYLEKYPGAQLTVEIDSIRRTGPVAVEEGIRTLTTKDAGEAVVRYVTIWSQSDGAWKIASSREFAPDSVPTSQEHLQPLGWLVGEWVNEGSDAAVAITYRWSDDGNFLLGNFLMKRGGEVTMKSEQRIGWDPAARKIRSWMFDSDGGFAQGEWTALEDGWMNKSSAVLPDGTTGSATITITPIKDDRYTITGTDRIVGDVEESDFEVTVVRKAPAPSEK